MAKILLAQEAFDIDKARAHISLLEFHPSIDRERFVWVPGTDSGINLEEPVARGKTLFGAAEILAQRNTMFPLTRYFMPLVAAVLYGEHPLVTLEGNEVSPDHRLTLRDKLARNYWIHLGTEFVNGSGYRDLDIMDYHVKGGEEVRDPLGSVVPLSRKREPLLQHAPEGYVSFTMNQQGLPLDRCFNQAFLSGKTMYLHTPQPNHFAGFSADSGRASLGCRRGGPQNSNAARGVSERAEGTRRAN